MSSDEFIEWTQCWAPLPEAHPANVPTLARAPPGPPMQGRTQFLQHLAIMAASSGDRAVFFVQCLALQQTNKQYICDMRFCRES